MLVDLNGNLKVNVADIVEVRLGHKGEPTRVKMRDDHVFTVDDRNVKHIFAASCTVLPAQPGFEHLSVCFSYSTTEDDCYCRQPIIGWRLRMYGQLEPVILDDLELGIDCRVAIKTPDGQVIEPLSAIYESEEKWRECMKAEGDGYREGKQAKSA
jgi:hypothetical protein